MFWKHSWVALMALLLLACDAAGRRCDAAGWGGVGGVRRAAGGRSTVIGTLLVRNMQPQERVRTLLNSEHPPQGAPESYQASLQQTKHSLLLPPTPRACTQPSHQSSGCRPARLQEPRQPAVLQVRDLPAGRQVRPPPRVVQNGPWKPLAGKLLGGQMRGECLAQACLAASGEGLRAVLCCFSSCSWCCVSFASQQRDGLQPAQLGRPLEGAFIQHPTLAHFTTAARSLTRCTPLPLPLLLQPVGCNNPQNGDCDAQCSNCMPNGSCAPLPGPCYAGGLPGMCTKGKCVSNVVSGLRGRVDGWVRLEGRNGEPT